jgi:hypothetical protein
MVRAGLDVVEKIDRFVEEPEAAEAGNVEDRNQEGSSHKSQEKRVNDWVCQP